MSDGIKCPPATHKYKPHGKVLVCTACADVQPLLMEEPAAVSPPGSTGNIPPLERQEALPPETVPLTDEAQLDALRNLRDLVSRGGVPDPAQLDLLGQRGVYSGDLSDLEMAPPTPRARVDEGYNTDPREDRLPSAGL